MPDVARRSAIVARAANAAPPRLPVATGAGGVWQVFEIWKQRIEAQLDAFAARKPEPGKDGRGILRPVIENGCLLLFWTDGTFDNVGRIVGQDGAPADPKTLVALADAIAALEHQVEDLKSALAHDRKNKGELAAAVVDLRAQLAAVRPHVATDWTIDQDGDLKAILADGQVKRIGRVVGRDGAPGVGAPGAPGKDGEPGRDGEPGKDGAPAPAWTPDMIAAGIAAFTAATKASQPRPNRERANDTLRRPRGGR